MKYAIEFTDDGTPAYWVTRCGDTDNYTIDRKDATLFPSRSSALCIIRALSLDGDHFVSEIAPCY